ncbi:hypothetical protein EV359DRAFT_68406 [Lentinula novae-zelandiae]|nr:hypothetical protein EV359DRAFT_68406 [Lentinula novae-zelandiae]
MFFRNTFPSLLALCNIGFTITVGAAPVPDLESQTIPYYAEGQLRLSAPSLLTFLPPPSPPPPPPPPPSSNDSLPLTFMMPKWVTAPYPQSLKNEDRDVFGTTLQGITLAKKHSSMGNNNAGVYSVASFDSSFARSFPPSIAVQNIEPSRLLVKVLKQIDDDMVAEVKALTIVGQFVASGLLRLPIAKSNDVGIKRSIKTREVRGVGDTFPNDDDLFELKPVIVMLQMPGKPLTHVPEFISEKNLETKRQMMGDTLKLMCDRVGKLALEHRFVHRDNIIGNILVINKGTEVVDVNIIDWGGKYLSSINDDVTWDDLMGWCHNRWAVYVWEARTAAESTLFFICLPVHMEFISMSIEQRNVQ